MTAPSPEELIARLRGPVVVPVPAELRDRDKYGWDICAQAYILASRASNRELADALTRLYADLEEARKQRDEAQLEAVTNGEAAGAWQVRARAAEASLADARRSALEDAAGVGITLREGNMMLDNEPPLYVRGYEAACADFVKAIRALSTPPSGSQR